MNQDNEDWEAFDPLDFTTSPMAPAGPLGYFDIVRSQGSPLSGRNQMDVDEADEDELISDEMVEYWKTLITSQSMPSMTDAFKTMPSNRAHSSAVDIADGDDDELKDMEKFESEFFRGSRRRRNNAAASNNSNVNNGNEERRPGRRKGQANVRRLPLEAQVEMGQANNAFLDGDYDRAIELLKSLIHQFPDLPDPYQTLAMVYEEMGDADNAMLLYMVAAHFKPSDIQLWQRNAELAKSAGLLEQAAYCLRYALRAAPDNQHFYEELASVLLSLQQRNKAIRCMLELFRLRPTDIILAQEICRNYLEVGDCRKALQVYQACLRNNGFLTASNELVPDCFDHQQFSLDSVNIYCELLIMNDGFEAARGLLKAIMLHQRNQFAIDLKAKYCICCIHLRSDMTEYASMYNDIVKDSVDNAKDLIYEIASAYHAIGEYQRALSIIQMIYGDEFDEPETWLRIADCAEHLQMDIESAKYYQMFLDEYPFDVDVRFMMCRMLDRLGHGKIAAELRLVTATNSEAIEMPQSVRKLAVRLTESRESERRNEILEAKQLMSGGQFAEAVAALKMLIREFEGSPRLSGSKNAEPSLIGAKRSSKVKKHRRKSNAVKVPDLPADLTAGESDMESSAAEGETVDAVEVDSYSYLGLSKDDWFDMVLLYCSANEEMSNSSRKYLSSVFATQRIESADLHVNEAHRVCKLLSRSRYFSERARFSGRLKNYSLTFSVRACDLEATYDWFRKLHQRNPSKSWILQSLLKAFDNFSKERNLEIMTFNSGQKYLTRILHRSQMNDAHVLYILGVQLMVNRNFVSAIQFLGRAFHILPNEPLVVFCLGIAQLQRAMQRRSANRHADIMMAIGFLDKYKSLRLSREWMWLKQEVSYNIGRAFHFIGAFHLAVHQYNAALAMKSDSPQDISKEVAHNLFTLYRTNGSDRLASSIVKQYLTV